jgi:hypothetical protein
MFSARAVAVLGVSIDSNFPHHPSPSSLTLSATQSIRLPRSLSHQPPPTRTKKKQNKKHNTTKRKMTTTMMNVEQPPLHQPQTLFGGGGGGGKVTGFTVLPPKVMGATDSQHQAAVAATNDNLRRNLWENVRGPPALQLSFFLVIL